MRILSKPPAFISFIWPILIFVLLLILHVRFQNYPYDDAYIHIRIADHLVQYGKPYFNIGEAVNASSSPAWTILVAAVMFVSRFHLAGMAILGALISALGVTAFIALLSSEASLSLVDRIILGAAYLAITLPSSIGWMETPLALLVMSVALLRYKQDRVDAFVLFGLAPFIRLEFAALYVIVFSDGIVRKKQRIGPLVAYSLAGAAPFLAYELYFFGTIIPNTIIAKSVVYSLNYREVLNSILSSFIPTIALWVSNYNFLKTAPSWIMYLAILPVAIYLLYPKLQATPFLFKAVTAFGAVVMAAYVLGRTFMFPWYFPIFLVPLLVGFFLSIKKPYPPIIMYATRLLAVPILGLWMLAFIQISISAFCPGLLPDFAANARTRSYLQIGQDLYRKYPRARLMTSEIGALGYAFPGYILDGAGLVTPAALRYYPLNVPRQRSNGSIGAIPYAFIRATQPEIIVSMPLFIEEFRRRGDKSIYVLFQEPILLPGDSAYAGQSLWGTEHINIYIRRDILAQAPVP